MPCPGLRDRNAEGSLMATATQTPGPNLLRECSCGHRATRHPRTGERPCVVLECRCEKYELVPLQRCASCNHTPGLHHPTAPQNLWSCKAPGCQCAEWRPPGPKVEDRDVQASDDQCIIVMEFGHARVTISIPRDVGREVLARETQVGAEIVLSRPSRIRRPPVTNAADQCG